MCGYRCTGRLGNVKPLALLWDLDVQSVNALLGAAFITHQVCHAGPVALLRVTAASDLRSELMT